MLDIKKKLILRGEKNKMKKLGFLSDLVYALKRTR